MSVVEDLFYIFLGTAILCAGLELPLDVTITVAAACATLFEMGRH